MGKTALFIIDMQNDFCYPKFGKLYVDGAKDDVRTLSDFIHTNCDAIDTIILTQDSHQPFSIFFTNWWMSADGNSLKPYTVVTLEDIEKGIYIPKRIYQSKETKVDVVDVDWEKKYLKELESKGKQLILWPEHCLMGEWGECIQPTLFDEVTRWAIQREREYQLYKKGESIWTEQYSAFETLVPFDTEPHPYLDNILNANYDRIIIAGEAMNYCVKETLASLIQLTPKIGSKLVVLTDCMSAIGDFNIENDSTFNKIIELGGELTNTKSYSLNEI